MKADMAARRTRHNGFLAQARKDEKAATKLKNYSRADKLQREIVDLTRERDYYKANVIPVQFTTGLIINGTLLKAFMNKRPAPPFTAEISTKEVKIMHKTGSITLLDMTKYYGGMKLPKGEELLDELGITIL